MLAMLDHWHTLPPQVIAMSIQAMNKGGHQIDEATVDWLAEVMSDGTTTAAPQKQQQTPQVPGKPEQQPSTDWKSLAGKLNTFSKTPIGQGMATKLGVDKHLPTFQTLGSKFGFGG